jgi:uncharacterized membrane protein
MTEHQITSILLIGAGILFVILPLPLYFKKIKMNHWYGVRIPKSFKSEKNWYRINQYGAKWLIIWSIVPLLSGIMNLIFPFVVIRDIHLMLLIVMGPVIIALFQILIYAKKL